MNTVRLSRAVIAGRTPHTEGNVAHGLWAVGVGPRAYRFLLGLLLAGGFVISAQPAFAAVKSGPAVVELVDFTCAHCRAESTYIPRILRAVRAAHGRFEVAPVQPAPGAEPTESLLAYYAELTAYPRDGVRAAAALYAGYAQGAALESGHGTLSWLGLHGLPTAKAYPELAGRTPLRRWTRAVRLAYRAHVVSFPAFVVIDPRTGAIQRVWRWHGHAGRLARTVVTTLHRTP